MGDSRAEARSPKPLGQTRGDGDQPGGGVEQPSSLAVRRRCQKNFRSALSLNQPVQRVRGQHRRFPVLAGEISTTERQSSSASFQNRFGHGSSFSGRPSQRRRSASASRRRRRSGRPASHLHTPGYVRNNTNRGWTAALRNRLSLRPAFNSRPRLAVPLPPIDVSRADGLRPAFFIHVPQVREGCKGRPLKLSQPARRGEGVTRYR
jgi:hypothetical protein